MFAGAQSSSMKLVQGNTGWDQLMEGWAKASSFY